MVNNPMRFHVYILGTSFMDLEKLQEYLLGKRGSEESFPFSPDLLVFKVMGKMFALVSLDDVPLRMNLKCDPEKAIELRAAYEAVRPGYHMSKKHWNTIIFDGSVSEDFIKTWIDHSYERVVSGMTKKAQRELAADEFE